MTDKNEILKTINNENLAWCVYIVLILLSFYSNHLEKQYYIYDDLKAKEDYRKLNIFIFSVAVIVYFYFFEDSYKSVKDLKPGDSQKKKQFTELNFTASSLILIGGLILLYIAIFDTELETEIALT